MNENQFGFTDIRNDRRVPQKEQLRILRKECEAQFGVKSARTSLAFTETLN